MINEQRTGGEAQRQDQQGFFFNPRECLTRWIQKDHFIERPRTNTERIRDLIWSTLMDE